MKADRKQSGFTLIELIVVIIIVGILAITVIPRFANKSNFEARGYYDNTLAFLQYAQKTAVAQRRRVCVRMIACSSPGSYYCPAAPPTLTIAPTFALSTGVTTNCPGSGRDFLAGPDGTSPYSLRAPPAGIAALSMSFDFLPSGVPVATNGTAPAAVPVNRTFSVSGYPGKIITIDGATGYVYSN